MEQYQNNIVSSTSIGHDSGSISRSIYIDSASKSDLLSVQFYNMTLTELWRNGGQRRKAYQAIAKDLQTQYACLKRDYCKMCNSLENQRNYGMFLMDELTQNYQTINEIHYNQEHCYNKVETFKGKAAELRKKILGLKKKTIRRAEIIDDAKDTLEQLKLSNFSKHENCQVAEMKLREKILEVNRQSTSMVRESRCNIMQLMAYSKIIAHYEKDIIEFTNYLNLYKTQMFNMAASSNQFVENSLENRSEIAMNENPTIPYTKDPKNFSSKFWDFLFKCLGYKQWQSTWYSV